MNSDPDTMMKFLLRLFGNQMTGGVELAWSDPAKGRICHGQMFQLDDLEQLVEAADKANRVEGTNCYIGAALRKPGGPPFGRGGDDDVIAATAYWADLDTAEAVKAARKNSGDTPANIAVITGRHPHPRAQLYWVQEQAIEDLDLLRRQNTVIATAFGGDRRRRSTRLVECPVSWFTSAVPPGADDREGGAVRPDLTQLRHSASMDRFAQHP